MRLLSFLYFSLYLSLSFAKTTYEPHYYSSYRLCIDGHLEEISPYSFFHDKVHRLSINYFYPNDNPHRSVMTFLKASRISLKTRQVKFPSALPLNDYLILSDSQRWFLNCVGSVVFNPNEKTPKLIFDVTHNSYDCPLAPASCRLQKNNQCKSQSLLKGI